MRTSLQIDQEHNHAIRDELGERLRIILWLERPQKLPGRIRRQIDRLAEKDRKIEMSASPSIVPSPPPGWLGRLFAGRFR